MKSMRVILRAVVMTAVATSLLHAQGGRGGNPPPTRADTGVRRNPDGPILEFREQDISIVLTAIAEAANVGINIGPIRPPSIRVTLRVAQQMTQENAKEMIKAIAERNGLLVAEAGGIILITQPAPPPPPVQ